MGRPREFDVDAALEKAMQAFWSKGYEAVSLDEICDATGLSRSSLYAAFGGKRDLLLRSLARYAEHGEQRIAKTLLRTVPFRKALEKFLMLLSRGPGDAAASSGIAPPSLPIMIAVPRCTSAQRWSVTKATSGMHSQPLLHGASCHRMPT